MRYGANVYMDTLNKQVVRVALALMTIVFGSGCFSSNTQMALDIVEIKALLIEESMHKISDRNYSTIVLLVEPREIEALKERIQKKNVVYLKRGQKDIDLSWLPKESCISIDISEPKSSGGFWNFFVTHSTSSGWESFVYAVERREGHWVILRNKFSGAS
jgi:hypothetical protein